LGELIVKNFEKLCLLFCGSLLASLAPAGAQAPAAGAFNKAQLPAFGAVNGLYLRLEGGGAWPAAPGGYGNFIGQTTTEVKPSYVAGVAVGYKFNAFRIEAELEYIQVGIKSISQYNVPAITINTSGTQSNLAGMINGYYDFETGTPWVPYLGIGVGVARFGLNNITATATNTLLVNGTVTTLAIQPMVGVQYNINDRLGIGVELRYFKTPDGTFTNAAGNTTAAGNAQFIVLGGLTYHFGR
jgi:opacity protein-like surface antigen